mmetsp:Transcript_5617/g.13193  ORF Transcript_5617/g.13193 Transcript_5617/m.13193 type:complete len:341 (-) Transcript_5617:54-1076(-)
MLRLAAAAPRVAAACTARSALRSAGAIQRQAPAASLLATHTSKAAQLLFCRCSGSQTPISLLRSGAKRRGAAMVVARQSFLTENPGVLGAMADAHKADEMAAAAHKAAAEGKKHECEVLTWKLKALPREQSVLQAVDKLREVERTKRFRTLLQVVTEAGIVKSTQDLLEMQAQVNMRGPEDGRTALHAAIYKKNRTAARLLLAKGRANVNAQDLKGRTPLHVAALEGDRGTIKVLLDFGAKMDLQNNEGQTPADIVKGDGAKALFDEYKARLDKIKKRNGRANLTLKPHIVAPKLVMTPVGYCPEEDGKVVQLARGIRNTKRRSGVSTPKGIVNWYSPRG